LGVGTTDLDLAIVNGTVVTATDVVSCDLGIKDGRVALIGTGLGSSAANTIDATGKLLLPGGIDAHCHLDQESPSGLRHADDFYSGSRAAAGGGTTTIIPFANQKKHTPLRAIIHDYHERARGKAIIDYAFHLIISDPSEQSVGQELPALIREGYTSFKVFMTYDALRLTDGQILNLLAMARREGALVMVHAENHDCIVWLTEQLMAAGHTAPRYHTDAHSAVGEREATHRAIALAEIAAAPVLIVHVSAKEAMREIQYAQSRGLPVLAETCPQYLVLDSTQLDCAGFEGAKYICSPPPRDAADQEALWRGLASGVFQVFSSDHAPYRYADSGGKMKHGPNAPFSHIANGIPGLETRLPLLFSYGVRRGRIDINQFVAVTATNPAKIYGLYPQKGTLAIGSDADVAIWDPDKEVRITHSLLHDNMDYTPYEGTTVRGWPVMTISRGDVVCTDGEVVKAAGRGRFLPCKQPMVGTAGAIPGVRN
jgi:dihydropyrimidinase